MTAVPRFEGLGRATVDVPEELEPLERYLADVLADVRPLPSEQVTLDDALGRVLAEDVVARSPLPGFANAAMDGYAVRAADTGTASTDAPAELDVLGEVAAGAGGTVEVRPGGTVRIMTGAPLPPGADAVVPVELTAGATDDGRVRFQRPVSPGQHVRRAGDDVAAGDRVATSGQRLGPAAVAILAAVGRATVTCHRRARVTVIPTGDELTPAGDALGRGALHDSNGPMLLALARTEGADAVRLRPVPDDPGALRAAITSAAEHGEVVLLSGGVSAGTRDHLPDVLADLGTIRRARLAMKPGKPQVLGRVGDCRVLGLPGNPVSSFVSFELFALPLLRSLHGRTDVQRPVVVATAGEDLRGSRDKRTFLRVRLEVDGDRLVARSAGGQGSHVLSTLTEADGLAEIPEELTDVPAGAPVRVRLLSDLAGTSRGGA